MTIAVAVGVTTLPDIDFYLGVGHRKGTHSILFALIIGVLLGSIFYYGKHDVLWFKLGFIAGFGGIMCHLLGDILNVQAFPPFWPIIKTEFSYEAFLSSSEAANDFFLKTGAFFFMIYILAGTGTLQILIDALETIFRALMGIYEVFRDIAQSFGH